MGLKQVSFGDNALAMTYSLLKSWSEKSAMKTGAKGFFEKTGKTVVLMPAHLLLATAGSLVAIIYDLVLTLSFGTAALCTGFQNKKILAQFLGHLGSLGGIPEQAFRNLAATLCPILAYRSDNIRDIRFERELDVIWADEIPELAWNAFTFKFTKGMNFINDYTQAQASDEAIQKSRITNKIRNKEVKQKKKWQKNVQRIPFGSNLMDASLSVLKNWYQKSLTESGAKGFFEKLGKTILVVPAHLLVGIVQAPATLIYDLALGIIFSLAATLTLFKYHSLNVQALGHLGSFIQIPGKALKNIAIALFCPPLTYRSDNIRKLQLRITFGEILAAEAPQKAWERHLLGVEDKQAKIMGDKLGKRMNSKLSKRINKAVMSSALSAQILAVAVNGALKEMPFLRQILAAVANVKGIAMPITLLNQYKNPGLTDALVIDILAKFNVAIPEKLDDNSIETFTNQLINALMDQDSALILFGIQMMAKANHVQPQAIAANLGIDWTDLQKRAGQGQPRLPPLVGSPIDAYLD